MALETPHFPEAPRLPRPTCSVVGLPDIASRKRTSLGAIFLRPSILRETRVVTRLAVYKPALNAPELLASNVLSPKRELRPYIGLIGAIYLIEREWCARANKTLLRPRFFEKKREARAVFRLPTDFLWSSYTKLAFYTSISARLQRRRRFTQ